jgi:hypothetical protein
MSLYLKLSCWGVFVGAIKPLLSQHGNQRDSFRLNQRWKIEQRSEQSDIPEQPVSNSQFQSDWEGLSMVATYLPDTQIQSGGEGEG